MYPSIPRFGGKRHNRGNSRNPPNNTPSLSQQSNRGGFSQSQSTRTPPSQENSTGANPTQRKPGRHHLHGARPSLQGPATGKGGGASAKAAPVKASRFEDFWNRPTLSAGKSTILNGKQASTKDTVRSELEIQSHIPSPTGFQSLPAELRLKIYSHLFTTYRVEIVRKKSKPTENTKKPHYRLYHKRLRPREDRTTSQMPGRWWLKRLPMALIFTCRSIYSDTILLLYAHTQFVFTTTKAITRFIKVTPADAQASIRHVEINHIMYNEPRLTKFRIYKARSDMAFYLACEELALAFTSLRVLHIDMRIYDWPIRLQIGELWSLPLLFFGQEGGPKLDEANVCLRMVMFSSEALRNVARELEQRMMGPVKFQIREDERIAREMQGLGRKAKVLRLVM